MLSSLECTRWRRREGKDGEGAPHLDANGILQCKSVTSEDEGLVNAANKQSGRVGKGSDGKKGSDTSVGKPNAE